ncbi:MAG: tetratricopeptide repeat protein [Thermoanaerobaculia bacterium]
MTKAARPRVALPVLAEARPAKTIRRSGAARWRAAVLIGIHLLVAIHIAHWLATGRSVTPVEPSEAMAYSKASIVNAGLIFFAGAILLTAVFGRWFCGWACHLVALQDFSRWLLEKAGIRPRPLRSRLLRVVPFLAFVYMFLWPLAYRIWLGDSLAVRGSELTTSAFWETFPGWIVGTLTFLVCGFATIYFLGAKGFCTYACPYGAVFAVADRVAPLRVRVTDACEGCGHCTSVCTSNVRVHEEVRDFGMVVDSGCMKCGDCVSVCPNDALYFGLGPLPAFGGAARAASSRRSAREQDPPDKPGPEFAKRHYPLSLAEECVLGVAFAAAFLAFRGLFGDVPFLMSLGLGGVLAFLSLLAFRLVTRRDFAYRHRALRTNGRLQPAGWRLIAALAAVALFWGYCAFLRIEVEIGQKAFQATASVRQRSLDLFAEAAPPLAAERAAAAKAAIHLGRVERLGFARWRGLANNLAWARFLAGDRQGFAAASALAIARGEASYDLLLQIARAADEAGDLASLALAGERAIALDPRRPEAYLGIGIRLARSGSAAALEGARALFERGLARFPGDTRLIYNLGVVDATENHPENAIERFRQVLSLDPAHREARENLAGMLALTGRADEAATLYREAIAAAPQDADLRVLLAQTWIAMGREEAARQELDAALKINPNHPQAKALAEQLAPAARAH